MGVATVISSSSRDLLRQDQLGCIVRIYEPESFEHQLDLAVEIGATSVEVTQAQQLAGVDRLLADLGARTAFEDAFRRRGRIVRRAW